MCPRIVITQPEITTIEPPDYEAIFVNGLIHELSKIAYCTRESYFEHTVTGDRFCFNCALHTSFDTTGVRYYSCHAQVLGHNYGFERCSICNGHIANVRYFTFCHTCGPIFEYYVANTDIDTLISILDDPSKIVLNITEETNGLSDANTE